jgi:hypothetical protein
MIGSSNPEAPETTPIAIITIGGQPKRKAALQMELV